MPPLEGRKQPVMKNNSTPAAAATHTENLAKNGNQVGNTYSNSSHQVQNAAQTASNNAKKGN